MIELIYDTSITIALPLYVFYGMPLKRNKLKQVFKTFSHYPLVSLINKMISNVQN